MSHYRTTAGEVKEIIATDISDAVVEANFVNTANVFIDANLLDAGLSDPILAKIEMYLAAHYIAIGPEEMGAITFDKAGEGATQYADVYSAGLNSSRYGQTAMSLDSSGTLQRIASTKMRAELRVV